MSLFRETPSCKGADCCSQTNDDDDSVPEIPMVTTVGVGERKIQGYPG